MRRYWGWGFGWNLHHELEALANQISVLVRDPAEISCLFQHMRTQDIGSLQFQRGPLLEPGHTGTLILDF